MSNCTQCNVNKRPKRSQRGMVLVWVAASAVVLFGMAAYAIDISYWYSRKAEAQQAADAAALAAAYQLEHNNSSAVTSAAVSFAKRNGYDNTLPGVSVSVSGPPYLANNNWVHVTVSKPEAVFFAPVFHRNTITISASSTARYSNAIRNPLPWAFYKVGGILQSPVYSLSVFGQQGYYDNGDCYDTLVNPHNTQTGHVNNSYRKQGLDFDVDPPTSRQFTYYDTTTKTLNTTSLMDIQLFDPDCYTANGQINASATNIDELRTPSGSAADGYRTSTTYTLYWEPQGPGSLNPVQIGNPVTYDGTSSSTDMQWVTPPGWTVDLSSYSTGDFRVNVTPGNGASENGFYIQGGASGHIDPTNPNGSSTMASMYCEGIIPMNFDVDGTATIDLGDVPQTCAGYTLTITKFDTDVPASNGSRSLHYTTNGTATSIPNPSNIPGTLAGNGAFASDSFQLSDDWSGGHWYAVYTAGSQDTSSWVLTCTGASPIAGSIGLVGTSPNSAW